MLLTRHATATASRWALDGRWLAEDFTLGRLLAAGAASLPGELAGADTGRAASGPVLAPVDDAQEVWASGVTFLRSRDARVHEAETKDIYTKVYEAERPEFFMKCNGWRARAHGESVRIRADSHWNVPEPELTLVINAHAEIVGYTAGNDMSSRDIEGANPLYLPQAKIYDGSCSLGPAIVVSAPGEMNDIAITLSIRRGGEPVFEGRTDTAQMKRGLEELADWLCRELTFPAGVLLLTGAGIVPPDDFTLQVGDVVRIAVGDLVLENAVAS